MTDHVPKKHRSMLQHTVTLRDGESNATNFSQWAVELLVNIKSTVQSDATVGATQKPPKSGLSSTQNFQTNRFSKSFPLCVSF